MSYSEALPYLYYVLVAIATLMAVLILSLAAAKKIKKLMGRNPN